MQWRENLISAQGRLEGEMLAQAVPESAATVAGEPTGATTHRLIGLINQVSPEEFRWQETNYDRDSSLGRELLFRLAHNEWIRATAEVIDVMRTDAVDTTIKVEIDPELVLLEAGRHRNGRLWLPVLVLPPPRDPTPKRSPEPDPFITLTVMDPDGIPFATLPGADVRHRIAAALAEIVVNMATARWPDTGDPSPYAVWDQRLVLAAAIYRLLNGESPDEPAGPDSAEPPGGLETMAQLGKARSQLYRTLGPFVRRQGEPDTGSASTLLQQLIQRAVTVLRAFSESVIVVVPVEPERIPSMLAIQVPSRTLSPLAREPWRLLDLSTWHWLHPDTWNWILPRAHLKIDLLLPSADADRLVQVNLPDGMSAFPAQPEKAAQLDIRVSQPIAMRHLAELMGKLTTELNTSAGELPSPLAQCLADLAAVKAEAARHALRGYHAEVPAEGPGQPDGIDSDDGNAVRVKLGELGGLLAHFPAEKSKAAAAAALAGIWQGGSWLPQHLWRVTSADILAPQTAVAKAGMIDDRFSRAAPVDGRIHLHVAVTDAQPVGIATFSGWMSLLFMTVVLALLVVSEKLFKLGSLQVSPEVLAIVLTLFAAIQAGRIERPDASALRGYLAANSNALIVLSILPAVIFAVALAFAQTGWWPFAWAGGCIAAQLALQVLMRLRAQSARNRSDERTTASAAGELVLSTDSSAHEDDEVLHSSWWRATTANALMIDVPAYGYVVQRGRADRDLRQLLNGAAPSSGAFRPRPTGMAAAGFPGSSRTRAARQNGPRPGGTDRARPAESGRPTNVLALLKSGTLEQSLTFAIFREQPPAAWVGPRDNPGADPDVVRVKLDFGQLAPTEDLFGVVDIFVGVPHHRELLTVAEHPVTAVLRVAAEQQPLVIEAQMPVPPPAVAWAGLQCAWIRVGLRDSDIGCLDEFLAAVRGCMPGVRPNPGQPDDSYVIAVKTVAEGKLRILSGKLPAPSRTPAPMVLARDLDVVTAYEEPASDGNGNRTWRVMAICANYRTGIESRIVRAVSQEMRIAGMTYALLQGKAVVLLLGQQPDGTADQAGPGLEAGLSGTTPSANIKVVLDRRLAPASLGWAGSEPLLEVNVRSPNRPGTTVEVLDALEVALREQCDLEASQWYVWHARTVVTPENLALIRFTLRLSADPQLLGKWNETTFEAIERGVRARVRDRANADGPVGQDGAIGEFLVRIQPITTEGRHSPAISSPLDWPGLAPQHFSVPPS